MTPAPVYGLVLAGGASSRMHRDKAALEYRGQAALQRAVELLSRLTRNVFVSVRANQITDPSRAQHPMIIDSTEGEGPIVGIRSALAAYSNVAWLVLACDLPFLSDAALRHLLEQRDPERLATAFNSSHDGLPEPLCAIWEPAAAAALTAYQSVGGHCPRKFLTRHNVCLLEPFEPQALDNINTPLEYAAAVEALRRDTLRGTPLQLKVQYYALMREQAGRSEEIVQTSAATPADLYQELVARYGFTLSREALKVAVNSEFSDWTRQLVGGDAVVFIPPVAGG